MNIVFEGPDNSGKSTLVAAVAEEIRWPIKSKEGKPASFGLTVEKIKYYLSLDHLIIDRHPVISQMIFGATVRHDPPVPEALVERFLYQRPLIVYCRCLKLGLRGHEASPTDTTEHLHALNTKYSEIVAAYDRWMAKHANIVYTDWDQTALVVAMIKGALRA